MGQELDLYNQRLGRAIRDLNDVRDVSITVGTGLFASSLAIKGYQFVKKSTDEASDGLWKVDLAMGALSYITPLKTPVTILTKGVKRAKEFVDKTDEKLEEIEGKKDKTPEPGEEDKTLLDKIGETLTFATNTNNLVRDGLTLRIQQLETAQEATSNFRTAMEVAMERGGVAWQGKYNNLNRDIENQLAARNAKTGETNRETSEVAEKFNDLKAIFASIDFPSINDGIVALKEFADYFAALAKPLDVAATLLAPIQPLFDAADLIVSLFVDPVVDFVLDELGMRPLLDFANELVDILTIDFDGVFDALSNLLQDYKDFILDLAETGLGMIPLLDKIEEAHFGSVVGSANEGPTGWGTAFGQTVNGDLGDDILDGLGGDDTIKGFAGNDVILGGEGSDSLEGGSGDDLFYFDASFTEYELFREDATNDIHVNHLAPRRNGINTGLDTIKAIEDGDHVVFTDISFTGQELRNAIFGGSVLNGTNNDDLIFLSSTGDTVNNFFVANGLDGNDRIFGSTKNDRLNGGRGDDLLLPGKGDDEVNGQAGVDTFQVLEGENQELRIDLTEGTSFGQGRDTLTSIENIIASPNQNHEIKGSNAANTIFSGDGIDVISGLAGDDVIHGGGEDDFLIGGAGSDTINAGSGTNVMISGSVAVKGVKDLYIGGEDYDMVSYTSSANTIRSDVLNHSDDPAIFQEFKESMEDVPLSGPVRIRAETGQIIRFDTAGNRLTVDQTVDVEGFMGSDRADEIYGAITARTLHGGGGDDEIWTGGSVNINGGGGDDLIHVQNVEEGATALQIQGGGGFDTLLLEGVGDARWFYKIEGARALQLRAFDVTTEGDDLRNTGNAYFSIKPRGIEEFVLGDNADHVIFAPEGSSTTVLRLNGGNDRIDGNDGFAEVFAGDGDDRGNFFSGSGIFHGEAGDDYVRFNDGSDKSQGLMGTGNDFVLISRSDGHADGGTGYDSISFEIAFSSRIVLNTAAGTVQSYRGTSINGVEQVEMTLKNFEELITTRFNDFIDGRSADEVFVTRGGADTVRARDGDDKLYGGGGNDSLWGGNGDDLLHGGAGNDILLGGNGRDTASYEWAVQGGEDGELTAGNFGGVDVSLVRGEASGAFGNDTLNSIENVIGTNTADRIQGSTQDNLLSGGGGDDTIFGLGGADILVTGDGQDLVFGGSDGDTVVVGLGVKTLYGGTGKDALDFGTLDGSMSVDFGTGTYTASLFTETPRWLQRDLDGDGQNESNGIEERLLNGVMMTPEDVLETRAAYANSYDDLIRDLPAEGEADFLASQVQLIDVQRPASGSFFEFEEVLGGRSDDQMFGNSADNTFFGGLGSDTLEGKGGGDDLSGGGGSDALYGGSHNDVLNGNEGRDILRGNGGADTLTGEIGKDDLNGGKGNDKLSGGGGADKLNGGGGVDLLKGGGGRDHLRGGDGADTLNGGSGADLIDGGAGRDMLVGGNGADVFLFGNNYGTNTITDFDTGDSREDIDLGGVSGIRNYADLVTNHISQQGRDVLIDDGAGTRIILSDIRVGQLDSSDFLF